MGLYELLQLTEPVRDMIMERASSRAIAEHALVHDGMVTLRRAGYDRVRQGRTTIEEVMRAAKA